MPFDIIGAKQAGYSDSEIAQELSGKYGFDYNGAAKSGYSDQEIIGELLSKSDVGVAPSNRNVSFGPNKSVDTRKISYTDTGYRPNKPASSALELAKNAVQDVVELPLAPVRMAADIANSPDTWEAVKQTGKSLVTTPAGFVPGLSDLATGKSATENWLTNPGIGATLALPATRLVSKGVQGAYGTITKPEPIATTVTRGMEKAIRPGIEGNRTYGQSQTYMGKAQQAITSILENKDNLMLTDEYGEAANTLPQNLKQFSQAIDQTKGEIFNRYDEMAKSAGESGAVVDLSPISKELNAVSGNKALQRVAPDVAKYAQTRANAFSKNNGTYTDGVTTSSGDFFTAQEAQQAISMLNNSLEAFYKNPSYDTASRAYIDSLVVNQLRKGLDEVIEKTTGTGYQELKNTYGALKSIEKDVNRRAVVDARKNVKGLIDFSDIFSGSEVIRGVMSMNPSTVGAGVTAKFISKLYKMKNDPNRMVKNMFQKLDKNYKREGMPGGVEKQPTPEPVTEPQMEYIKPLNLPTGQPTVFDPSIGSRIPINNDPLGIRGSLNLPTGQPTVFDPSIGARRPK